MKLIEERLDIEKHFTEVGYFCCGADDPLNNFLMDESFKYDEERYGNTYLIYDEESMTLLAFYTLKASGIQTYLDGQYNSVPVIEIARIAVQYEFQRMGLGKELFYGYILPKVDEVSKIVAVYGIIAFAEKENKDSVKYYKSLGFFRADERIQKQISESFNEECELYVVSLGAKNSTEID